MTSKLAACAYRDDDGSWTIEIPALTSAAPSGATIVATGSALSFRGVSRRRRLTSRLSGSTWSPRMSMSTS